MKVIELFAGIGSQTQALKNIGVDHEVVAVVEWDKYAYASYCALHGAVPNLGDITKVESLPECDMLTYSFPCQDISVAGKQAGLVKGSGTRSGLLWEVERLLLDYKSRGCLPEHLLLENVKNLVGKQHKPDFEAWLGALDDLGYNTYWQVLNAKNYGIPQNRERVFAVSVLKTCDAKTFKFPEPFDNGLRLRDFLEADVDEKYYISDEKCAKILSKFNPTQDIQSTPLRYLDRNQRNLPIGYSMCIDASQTTGVVVKENTKQGYTIASEGDSTNLEQPNTLSEAVLNDRGTWRSPADPGVASCIDANYRKGLDNHAQRTHIAVKEAVLEPNNCKLAGSLEHYNNDQMNRVYSPEGVSPTVTVKSGGGREPKVLTGFRVRRLTPRECWRLMGQKDEDFDKAQAVNSNTQLYHQAGNSIVVDVLEHIFEQLFEMELILQEEKEA